jgi:predicted nucleotidyltransferase/predicted RNase H-like HicB family nuclease
MEIGNVEERVEDGVKTYTVRAERDGKWWALSVAGLPGALSQVRRLDQAEAMAREVISLMTEQSEEGIEVRVVPDLIEPAKAAMDELDQAKASLTSAAARVTALQQRLARTLVEDQRLTVRDAGALMGVSFQRVAQLTAARANSERDGEKVAHMRLDDVKSRREQILKLARARKADRVRVFGSVVRGDSVAESDIDFLVDFDDEASALDQVGLVRDLTELLGVEVEVVSAGGLRERHEGILREAIDL